MARSNARWAKGTKLARNGNEIAELLDISGPKKSRATIDVTSHESDDDYEEFVAGLKNGGQLSISGNFYPGDTNGQMGLDDDFENGTLQSFVLTFPTAMGASISFSGLVTAFETTAPHNGKVGFSATIQVSGKPTFSVATSAGLTTPFFAISNGAVVTPAASGSVYDYVATVLTGITSVTLTPTASAGTITITANGVSQVVTSGVASSAIALGAAGTNTTVTVQVKEANKAAKTYMIRIARAAS